MKKITFLFLLAAAGAFAQDNPSAKSESPKTNLVATKRVLFEEATGIWCGWCVRGICNMNALNTQYPSTTGLVAVHDGDAITDATYDAGMSPKVSGYPSGLVDRQATEVDPGDFLTAYASRITYAPPVDVFIDNVSWNSSTRVISFRVNATTVTALSGSYNFNASITEMQVHGTTTAYAQHNYYAANASGPMCGFESKPDPIPAAQMYYDFVARAVLGGWAGTASSIPASVPVGTTVSYTYTKTIPAGWNENNLSLIGFVINNSNGTVENCSTSARLTTSIGENFKTEFVAYPNPTTDVINIRNADALDITVYDIMGEEVKSEKKVSKIDLSPLENGIYFLKFSDGKNVSTQKFLLNK